MITTCLGCALLAAWLAVPGAAARTVRMRLEPAAAALSIDAVAQVSGEDSGDDHGSIWRSCSSCWP